MADEEELWKDVADSKKKIFNGEKLICLYFTFLLKLQTQSFESLKYLFFFYDETVTIYFYTVDSELKETFKEYWFIIIKDSE